MPCPRATEAGTRPTSNSTGSEYWEVVFLKWNEFPYPGSSTICVCAALAGTGWLLGPTAVGVIDGE